jgi:hypothetical protein
MQSRRSSFIEAAMNTAIGYVISFIGQLLIYPAFGAHFSLLDNVYIGLLFMVLSLGRSYVIRRYFNGVIHKKAMELAS